MKPLIAANVTPAERGRTRLAGTASSLSTTHKSTAAERFRVAIHAANAQTPTNALMAAASRTLPDIPSNRIVYSPATKHAVDEPSVFTKYSKPVARPILGSTLIK